MDSALSNAAAADRGPQGPGRRRRPLHAQGRAHDAQAIGVKTVYEAPDGIAGLDAIRQNNPDLVIVDWEMPMIDGAQFVRMVRSPGEFPVPDVPIIMLSGHGDRWRVVEAARIGAHEYLLKPVSDQGAARPHRRHHRPAAPDREARRLLRPAAAPAGGDRDDRDRRQTRGLDRRRRAAELSAPAASRIETRWLSFACRRAFSVIRHRRQGRFQLDRADRRGRWCASRR